MSPAVATIDRELRGRAVPAPDGEAWWAEVADLRERIERRRAAERARHGDEHARVAGVAGASAASGSRRTVTITGHAASVPAAAPVRTAVAASHAAPTRHHAEQAWSGGGAGASGAASEARRARTGRADGRRRPRRTAAEWLGARPDRIAAWAVALGFLLVLAALISAH